MADLSKLYEDRELRYAVDRITRVLNSYGIKPGDELYVIRKGCHKCPDKDDHCQIDCTKKNKRYLEKIGLLKIECTIKEEEFKLVFIDEDGYEYAASALGDTVFIDREEALDKL